MLKKCNLVLLLSFLLSCPAMALEPIADSDMKNITARAGISMVIDDFAAYLGATQQDTIKRIRYSDTDGQDYNWYDDKYAEEAYGAEIWLDNFRVNSVHFEAISPSGQMGNKAAYFDPSMSGDIQDFTFRPLTIDVATRAAQLFWGTTTDARTGLIIGLPTLNVYFDELAYDDIRIHQIDQSDPDRTVYAPDAGLGSLAFHGLNITTLGGIIGIMNHSSSGIDIGMDDIQIFLKCNEIRYTDRDGQWNPITDVYQNIPALNNANDKKVADGGVGGIPFCLVLKDLEIDTLRINSLYFKTIPIDNSITPEIGSPGTTDTHMKTTVAQEPNPFRRLDNFKRNDMPALSGDIRGCPLKIDFGNRLPTATALGVSNSQIGLRISFPTLEMYAKEIILGGIIVDDPLTLDPTYQAANSFDAYPTPTQPNPDTGQPWTKRDLYRPVLNNDVSYMQVRIEDSLTTIFSGDVEVMAH